VLRLAQPIATKITADFVISHPLRPGLQHTTDDDSNELRKSTRSQKDHLRICRSVNVHSTDLQSHATIDKVIGDVQGGEAAPSITLVEAPSPHLNFLTGTELMEWESIIDSCCFSRTRDIGV
jgi:hypothetical protein